MNKIEKLIENAIEKMLTNGSENTISSSNIEHDIDDYYVGKYCIIRTYSAGVFSGVIIKKRGDEVIVNDCRRLWYWKTKSGISLSDVAKHGLSDDSKICEEINGHWLNQIELIPCSSESENDIRKKKVYDK